MSESFKLHCFNMVRWPGVALTGNGVESAWPVSQLLDHRLSRRLKFTEDAGEKSIVLDHTAMLADPIAAQFAKCDTLAVAGHNLSNLHSFLLLAHDSDSWGSPNITLTDFPLPADPDTDPDIFGETNITKKVYRTLLFNLGQDILAGGNTHIKLIVTQPSGLDSVEFGAIHLGWGLQFEGNYRYGWQQGYNDPTGRLRAGGLLFHNAKKGRATLKLQFDPSSIQDTHFAKYFEHQFGMARPLFVSLEPEQEEEFYEKEQIRAHGLTFYGRGSFGKFSPRFRKSTNEPYYRKEFLFTEDIGGPGQPPYAIEPGPIDDLDNPFVAIVQNVADEAVPTGADHQVIPDTVVYDPYGMYDASTGRFNILKSDHYNVWFAQAMEDLASATDRKGWILEGGSNVIARETKRNTTIAPHDQTRSVVLNPESGPRFLTAGSYVAFYLRHNHGSDVGVGGIELIGTYGIERAGPTSAKQCKARRTTALNVTSNNLTPVPLLVEDFDPDSMHVANDSKITIVDAGTGIWEAVGSVWFNTHADSYREANILKNAAEQGIEDGGEAVNSGGTGKIVKGTFANVIAGDDFEICGRQYSGSNLDILTAELYLREIAHSDESFIGCHARTVTSQNIPQGSTVALSLELEGYDTNAFHSTGTNPSRITIPSGLDGIYRILGHIVWTENSNTGWRMALILKNGVALNPPLRQEETVSAFPHEQYARDGLSLVAGDYIELAGNVEAMPTNPLAVTAADLFLWKVG